MVAVSSAVLVGSALLVGHMLDISGPDFRDAIYDGASCIYGGLAAIGNAIWNFTFGVTGLCETPESRIFGSIGEDCEWTNVKHNFWQPGNEWLRYSTMAATAGVGLYAGASLIGALSGSGRSTRSAPVIVPQPVVCPPSRQPGPNELRELTRRLRAEQAAQRA